MPPTPPDAPYAAYVAVMGGAPPDMRREAGYFNVFAVQAGVLPPPPREFKRLGFYKISLTLGSGCLEFADQRQQVGPRFLFLATPSLLYRWTPTGPAYTGRSCIFSDEFLLPARGGVLAQALPIFQPGAHPVIELTEADGRRVEAIFEKMAQEMASDYAYKYDLLRTYLVELIHLVQKLQPAPASASAPAGARLAAQFAELLERQFAPGEAPAARPRLRTAGDYAAALAVHVVYLNRVLKEATGSTTTTLIGNRLAHEAKQLLRQNAGNVSEIADALGFADVAHFCTFFKRHTGLTPGDFRQQPPLV